MFVFLLGICLGIGTTLIVAGILYAYREKREVSDIEATPFFEMPGLSSAPPDAASATQTSLDAMAENPEVQAKLAAFHKDNNDVEIQLHAGKIVLKKPIAFETNKADLKRGLGVEAFIGQVAGAIHCIDDCCASNKAQKLEFNIDGHTNTFNPEGKLNVKTEEHKKYHENLSEKRAKKVASMLKGNKVDENVLHVRWFGGSVPLLQKGDVGSNIRVEITVNKGEPAGNCSVPY